MTLTQLTNKYIVVYLPNNQLNYETRFFGPYNSHDEAYDALCDLPAIGKHEEQENGCNNKGHKYIAELRSIL